MQLFECQHCGNPVHFESVTCVVCGHRLGYLPDRTTMTAVEADGIAWRALADGDRYLFCSNAEDAGCNWLTPATDGPGLCRACRHNRLIPDISDPTNLLNWRKVERSKRHLFYSLVRWRLPTPNRFDDPNGGLVFDFLADWQNLDGTIEPVMTGHAEGVITINVAEADDAERERRRAGLGEPFRTVLGHFRHEVAHFYWDRLVGRGTSLDRFRAVFGDERRDYGEALAAHYASGGTANWQEGYVSAYATSHPWEDFAETFAHYVHMVDGLETGRSYGLAVRPRLRDGDQLSAEIGFDPYEFADPADLVEAWVPFTVAMNAVNRSLGQPDLYPFVLSGPVTDKLSFVHDLVHGRA
jgi:hypothetical protein